MNTPARSLGAVAALCLMLVVGLPALARSGDPSGHLVWSQDPSQFHSSTGSAGHAKAQADTFYLYGGPASVVGTFQQLLGSPGGASDPQGWIGYDSTEEPELWRVTDAATFTTTLDPGGFVAAANHSDLDYVGYGNGWMERLEFRVDVTAHGLSAAQTIDVRLQFDYVHDTEPGYDFFEVQWLQSGVYQTLAQIDGSSFNSGSMIYETRSFDQSFSYAPGELDGNDVVLRLRVTSDGGFSDEDGFHPTQGRGAAAIDDVRVQLNGVDVSLANWNDLGGGCGDCADGRITGHDNGAGLGTLGWRPGGPTPVGDFSKLFASLTDRDPCRSNLTPQFTFIDDGTPPNNVPGQSTGGSLGSSSYGVPGGYVVNYTGGLIGGSSFLRNEIRSPVVDWDLPGTADDVANGGAFLRYGVWDDLPLTNGIFRTWRVRSKAAGSDWGPWKNSGNVIYSDTAAYKSVQVDMSPLLVTSPERLQVALGIWDLAALFGLPGTDATPAPFYDDVAVAKYAIAGPTITARTIDLFSDGFPNDGTLTGSIRLDMCRDINALGTVNIAGDSIIADVRAVIPGTTLSGPPSLRWKARLNPNFNGSRAIPPGGILTGSDLNGWEIWAGEVAGTQSTANGTPIADRYYFDLPDGPASASAPHQSSEPGFFYPGDVIQYYIEAEDDLGNITTLPHDLTGFGDFAIDSYYPRLWSVRGLPTRDPGLTNGQPNILFWNDFGHRSSEEEHLLALRQIGYYEGIHFDTYTTKGASSGVGNGLGSAGVHGATADQLIDYGILIYACADLKQFLISDGSGANGNDKSDDLALLAAWNAQAMSRAHFYFGDSFAEGMVSQGASTESYLNTVLGVDYLDCCVGPFIDNQAAPVVRPTLAGSSRFSTEFVVYGGCPSIRDFDHIRPFGGTGAYASHEYLNPSSGVYAPSVPQAVYWERVSKQFPRTTFVMTADLAAIFCRLNLLTECNTGKPARSEVLDDTLNPINPEPEGNPVAVPQYALHSLTVQAPYPNPFNPRTEVSLVAPRRGSLVVQVFDVQGRCVATLLDEVVEAGPRSVRWDGNDQHGTGVASGLYFLHVKGFGSREVRKLVVLK